MGCWDDAEGCPCAGGSVWGTHTAEWHFAQSPQRLLWPRILGAFLYLFLGGLCELKVLLYLRLGKHPSPQGCQIFYFFFQLGLASGLKKSEGSGDYRHGLQGTDENREQSGCSFAWKSPKAYEFVLGHFSCWLPGFLGAQQSSAENSPAGQTVLRAVWAMGASLGVPRLQEEQDCHLVVLLNTRLRVSMPPGMGLHGLCHPS